MAWLIIPGLTVTLQANGTVKAETSDVEMENPEESANVEYVSEQLDIKGSALEAFSDVFARFQLPSEESEVRALRFISSDTR